MSELDGRHRYPNSGHEGSAGVACGVQFFGR